MLITLNQDGFAFLASRNGELVGLDIRPKGDLVGSKKVETTLANQQTTNDGVFGILLEHESIYSGPLLVVAHQSHCGDPLGSGGSPRSGVHRTANNSTFKKAHFAECCHELAVATKHQITR